MQVVSLGPKRVKISEINDYKNNWKDVQHKVNNQREGIQNNNKRAETLNEKCKNKTNNVVINESTVVVQKGEKIKTN